MEERSEEFWLTFHRAQELRARLRQIDSETEFEVKRAEIMALKRETFDLLIETGIPQPLRHLIAELWSRDFGFMERQNPAMYAAARIEARYPPDPNGTHPSRLSQKKLRRLINEEMGDTKDYTKSIRDVWRKKPEYRQMVERLRGSGS